MTLKPAKSCTSGRCAVAGNISKPVLAISGSTPAPIPCYTEDFQFLIGTVKMPWKLRRTRQCSKCPWRKDVDPYDIPNGYSPEAHAELIETIATEGDCRALLEGKISVMTCHETANAYCIGWLTQQLGVGNNIPLRCMVIDCENIGRIQTVGEQYQTFEDTLPSNR